MGRDGWTVRTTDLVSINISLNFNMLQYFKDNCGAFDAGIGLSGPAGGTGTRGAGGSIERVELDFTNGFVGTGFAGKGATYP